MFRVLLTTLLVFSFQFSGIAETLTIATWNFYSNYSANSDSKRQKLLTATKVLKDIDADIVVLQEVSEAGTENLKTFINTTPFVYDVIITEKPSVDRNYAMLYKSDKVKPKSDSVRYFDDVKHLKHDFFERDLGYAVFTTVEEDNTFILFNCHISHQGHKGLEVNKLDDVYERVMFGVGNAFFAGDFNIEEGVDHANAFTATRKSQTDRRTDAGIYC